MLNLTRPLRVAVLSSHRCPGAGDLLRDPARGKKWELVGALATEEDFAADDARRFESAGVPLISLPIRPFHRARGRRVADFSFREAWDQEVVARLAPLRPDLLLFSSYLYVATPVLLGLTRGRVVNIHGSDLSRRGAGGAPRYTGLRAVRDAILAGERETRATAHWATEELDLGPLILRSPPFPVAPFVGRLLARGDEKAVRAYAYAHQEWMLQEGWGPLWTMVIRLVAGGRALPARSRPRPTAGEDGPRLVPAPFGPAAVASSAAVAVSAVGAEARP